ncbi:hypothetical protein P8H27_17130 [Pseudomonas sp. sp1636]|uniref:hypothetical protein n=1 Tax=Pseudomonas sp. sp1636 TaxID=3036707 RepID=UPI0025A53511|nr:hypothetical protein [Pseudomonas sp. sp1636]MDM8350600.1 hypothetical protein [Pseudomonas sp. sp1636]
MNNSILLLLLPLLGTITGAALSGFILPMYLKRKQWRWEKEISSTELLIESISKIKFLAHHELSSTYTDSFSMSDSGSNTENNVIELVKSLHANSYKISPYLKKKYREELQSFLDKSQLELNYAKETHGQWDPDDHLAMEEHGNKLINSMLKVSSETLLNLGFGS